MPTDIRPLPFGLFTAYFTVIVMSLAMPPSTYRRLLCIPLLGLSWKFSLHGDGYLCCAFWFIWLLNASDYILLTDVQRELRKLPATQADSGGGREHIEEAPLARRLRWALDLFLSPRGVGWTHSPKRYLPSPGNNVSKRLFIRRRLGTLVRAVLLLDVLNLYVRWSPAYRTGLRMVGWPVELYVQSDVCALTAYAILEIPHCLLSIMAVATGVSAPEDWPPLFGRVAEGTNVRNFWGKCWHQLLRRPLTSHVRRLSHLLRLPARSAIATAVETSVAFGISGMVHYLAETVLLRGRGRSGSLIFFGLQPLAFAFEGLVAPLNRRTGLVPPRIASFLGYVWTATWFAWTIPFMQDPLIAAGETLNRYISVSFVLWVWRGSWLIPSVDV
ncbi:membrane bound O-acyl transferase family-domain-containing protein [Mycena polygramma]|nr:membrane bound O-acyl transferase family-domain-containing protein [Mycena polygramma]